MDITSQPESSLLITRGGKVCFLDGMDGGCPSFGIIAKRRISSHLAARVPAGVQGSLAEVRKLWETNGRRSHRVVEKQECEQDGSEDGVDGDGVDTLACLHL